MKFNGSHTFKVSSRTVFNSVLDPTILQACIPNCTSVTYLDANNLNIDLTTPLPGLKGPYSIVIQIIQLQDPDTIVLGIDRQGTGGSIKGTCHIGISDEPTGSILTYNAVGQLEGPIAIVSNPLGEGIAKNLLKSFFKKLDAKLV
jgi:carbon monoxide dehydrogenase subunit G